MSLQEVVITFSSQGLRFPFEGPPIAYSISYSCTGLAIDSHGVSNDPVLYSFFSAGFIAPRLPPLAPLTSATLLIFTTIVLQIFDHHLHSKNGEPQGWSASSVSRGRQTSSGKPWSAITTTEPQNFPHGCKVAEIGSQSLWLLNRQPTSLKWY